ncbi:MAG: DUF1269 domain-containing protein [Chloroflexi bacterium]|nr:DUF1269 domain-containing protein [Chloroflexota bacterium]
MGPIDYLVVEFPHRTTPGEGLPLFVDLVDRGIIRVLDLAFIHKDQDGSVRRMRLAELGPQLAVFEGASAHFLAQEDIDDAAEAIQPDSTAFVLIYENRWAAPLGRAMRHGGGQMVSSGRLPVQAILAALDATAEYDK